MLALTAVSPGAGPAEDATLSPRIECGSFDSKTLQRTLPCCVVLPENYSHDVGDWPVLFLLHGRGRTCRSLIDDADARAELLRADFVIVLPQGEDGWYIDSPVRADDRYETYLTELIVAMRERYRLSDDPRRQGICGWSMGGYGCVRYATAHPGEFGFVAPIIGLLDFPRSGLPDGQRYEVPAKRFGSDAEVWATFNPIHAADRLRLSTLLIITAREAFDRTMNENFRDRLVELKIDHKFVVLDGGHKFEVVRAALPLVVESAHQTLVCQ